MDDNRKINKVSEALGRGSVDFNNELQRIDKEELIAANFVILQAKIVEDWESEFGTNSFCLLKIRLENGEEKKTLMGGKAIVRQVTKLIRNRKLPVACCLNRKPGSLGDYYVLEDPIGSSLPAETSAPEEPIFAEAQG